MLIFGFSYAKLYMKKRNLLYLIVLLLTLYSCIPSKKVTYLQDLNHDTLTSKYFSKSHEYLLQNGDNLYVSVESLDTETQIALSGNLQMQNVQGVGAKYKDVYFIDNEGFINLPHIGKLQIVGKSLSQAYDTINFKYANFFNQVKVNVRLANGYITILGEVNKPGRYELTYEDRISIYELLGLAGDLKKQADRNNVKIVRRNNDENQVFIIDLTKANALENPIFYLQPNDLVYVEPLKAVFWEQESFPFMSTVSIVLATITSLLVIFTYSKQ